MINLAPVGLVVSSAATRFLISFRLERLGSTEFTILHGFRPRSLFNGFRRVFRDTCPQFVNRIAIGVCRGTDCRRAVGISPFTSFTGDTFPMIF